MCFVKFCIVSVSTAMLSTAKDVVNTPTTMISTKDAMAQKFTTSNFTETVVVNSDLVFGGEGSSTSAAKSSSSTAQSSGPSAGGSASSASSSSGTTISVAKKRKVDVSKLGAQGTATDDPNK